MKLTFRYPVYPTRTQETTLLDYLDHLCELQNSARHDRKVAWETEGERVSCNEQQRKLKVARETYADFREVPQDMQVCALERMDKAFDGFYRRCKEGTAKKGYPRHRKSIRSMSWKLRKHSKDLCRKKLGSHRRKKQQHKLALHHERTTNRRKDFIGKLVYKLYHHKGNNVLVAEDLRVSNMVQNKYLSKSISDASWSAFFKWCGNMVSERDGFHFHQVDPKNTSQTCSSCGQKSPKKLSLAIRTFDCSFCGTVLDRDHNAALNILLRAAAALRGERWVATLNETRNKNEARDTGSETAEQLLLFNDLLTSLSL